MSGAQLPISDREVILQQHERRMSNHSSSELSKAGGRCPLPAPKVQVGSLVYLYADRDKTVARQRYMVIETNFDGLHKLRKFASDETFRKEIYEVKPNDVYCVPQYYPDVLPSIPEDSSDEESFEDASNENPVNEEVIHQSDHSGQESASSDTSDETLSENSDSSPSDEEAIPPAELTDPPESHHQFTKSHLRRRRSGVNYRDNRQYSSRR